MRRVTPGRALWAGLVAGLAGCGVLGPDGVGIPAADTLSAMVFAVCAALLALRAGRRIRQRRWRRAGNQVRAVPGPADTDVRDLRARLDAAERQLEQNGARLDDYDVALSVIARARGDETGARRHLSVVEDRGRGA